MKYQVGDKVVEKENISMLFNPYWKKKYAKSIIQTVTEADDNFFTTYTNKYGYDSVLDYGHECGANKYVLFRQSDGTAYDYWCNKKQLLHLERDKEEILKIFKTEADKEYNKKTKLYKSTIDSYTDMLHRFETEHACDYKKYAELLQLQ